MVVKIYLIRHGETDFNKLGKEWGQEDSTELNDWGYKQAENVAQKLKNIKFDRLLSSDLKRAMQTSQRIASTCNIEITPDERLREYDPGNVDPSSEKWVERYKELLATGMSKYDIRPFGGENIWDLIKRTQSFLESMEKEKGTIAIMAHSGVNAAFINLSQGREKNDFLSIKQDNTCVNIIEYNGDKWTVSVMNDSEHNNDLIPKKKVYENQQKIKQIAKEYATEKLNGAASTAYLVGDVIEGGFALYNRPYKRYKGSNVEILAVLNEDFEIPQEWKVSMMTESIKKYEIGKIKVDGVKHKVNVTIIKGEEYIREKEKENLL